jgi:hypothetical protein
LQVSETQETLKLPEKTGFLELRRLSQLSYGDVTVSFCELMASGKAKRR